MQLFIFVKLFAECPVKSKTVHRSTPLFPILSFKFQLFIF